MIYSITRSTFSPRKGYCSLPLLPKEGDRVAFLHIRQHLWLTVRILHLTDFKPSSETVSGESIVIHGWSPQLGSYLTLLLRFGFLFVSQFRRISTGVVLNGGDIRRG